MQRSRVERVLAVLLAVWFVLVTIEPAALHTCAVHGGAHATAAAAEHHGGHDTAGDPASANHCSCLGDCAAAVTSALPARALTPWPASVAAVSSLPPLAALFVPPAIHFARPFANGPPLRG